MSSHTDDAVVTPARGDRRMLAAYWLSWLAALFGVGLFGVFAWQAGMFAALLPSEPVTVPDIANPQEVTSTNTRLTGYDKDNNPYWVTAEQGRQDAGNADIYLLSALQAQFTNAKGATFDVAAARGTYNVARGDIALAGGVTVMQGDRLTVRMPEAQATLKDRTVVSESGVEVTLRGGEIRAKGLRITNDGNNILFFNGVHATFDQTPSAGASQP